MSTKLVLVTALILASNILRVCCNEKNPTVQEDPIIFAQQSPRKISALPVPAISMLPRDEFVPSEFQESSLFVNPEASSDDVINPYASLTLDDAFKFGYEAGRIISSQDNGRFPIPDQYGRTNKAQQSKQTRCILGIYDLIFPQPKYYAREPGGNTRLPPPELRRSATVLGRQPLFLPPRY